MAARKSSSTVVGVDGPVRDEVAAAAERAVRKALEEGLKPALPAGVELAAGGSWPASWRLRS